MMPEQVPCANPTCPQTFWRWRAADPQRFCSRVCSRQMQRQAPKPSRPSHAQPGRPKPGVAEATRRRWALWREQRAQESVLRLLAEAGLGTTRSRGKRQPRFVRRVRPAHQHGCRCGVEEGEGNGMPAGVPARPAPTSVLRFAGSWEGCSQWGRTLLRFQSRGPILVPVPGKSTSPSLVNIVVEVVRFGSRFGAAKREQAMSRIDLKRLQPGDLVEYQQLVANHTARGTFQRWHSTDDGQARLIVRSQQVGIDFSVNPKRVVSITYLSEGAK